MAGRTRRHRGSDYTVSAAHPAADLFPWLDEDELQQLADDIKANGQKQKVVRHKGRVVDGRNRELACLVAGVRVEYADLPADTPEEKILAGVISANLKRRHLTTSQRAAVAAELANMKEGGNNSANLPSSTSQSDAAKQLNVSTRSVTAAVKVKNEAPELFERVKDGDLAVHTAARLTEYPQPVREEVAKAEDPKEAAHDLLAETDNLPDEPDEPGEEEAPPPMTDELPEPSIDAGKRPIPSWMTPGNKVDPNHPFAKLLHKLSSLSADFSKAFKTEQGKILLRALADLANLPMKVRFVLFTSDRVEGDEHVAGRAKFVGFHSLRDVVKKAGLAKKPLTVKSIRKSFLDALAASDQDMLDSEVWE